MREANELAVINEKKQYKRVLTYRWIIYTVLLSSYILGSFHRLAAGVVKDELMSGFSMSATAFANLGAMYFYTYGIMQIPAGIFSESIGVKKTVIVGSLVSGLGSILFGMSSNVFLTFIGRGLVGIGVSVTFVCIAKMQTMWFREDEFGKMTGMTAFIGNVAGVFALTPLAVMVSTFTFKYTFVFIGLLSLLVAVLSAKFLYNKPEDMGLPSIAEIEGRKVEKQDVHTIGVMEGLKRVLRNKKTWPPFVLLMAYTSTFFAFTGTWGIAFFVDAYGMSKIEASNNIVLILISMAFGALAIGALSDKMKSRKIPLIAFGVIANIAWIVFALVLKDSASLTVIRIMMVLYGFFISAFILVFSITKESNNPMYSGMAVAVVNIGAFVGGSIGPVIFGVFLDRVIGIEAGMQLYRSSMIYCTVMNLTGLMVSLLVKEPKQRSIIKDIG